MQKVVEGGQSRNGLRAGADRAGQVTSLAEARRLRSQATWCRPAVSFGSLRPTPCRQYCDNYGINRNTHPLSGPNQGGRSTGLHDAIVVPAQKQAPQMV